MSIFDHVRNGGGQSMSGEWGVWLKQYYDEFECPCQNLAKTPSKYSQKHKLAKMANIWPPIYRKHTLSDLSLKIEENNVSIFFYYELKCISYGIYWVLAQLLPKNGQITPNQEENGQKKISAIACSNLLRMLTNFL